MREGALWRRHDERHVLRLFDTDAVVSVLESAGFGVARSQRYGDIELPVGLNAFLGFRQGAV